jgi:rhodanese-related sulfurtransferase
MQKQSIIMRIILFLIILIGCTDLYAETKPLAPSSIPGASVVSATETVELILSQPDLVIIDSRKQQEYTKGHIEGAVSILDTYMQEDDLQEIAPDRSAPILFYCNGIRCLRSSNAIKKAIDWGYTHLYWFRGGWKEWQENRLPIAAGEYQYPAKNP